ncbi:MAG: AbrB/MazE/SpoVT family DNA-binding domain-containing protein [Methanosphaera sp.]|nr:AbrB/MazE/SpoVT family DNA-binding domain-containing protein [Methanosphaera sp.]
MKIEETTKVRNQGEISLITTIPKTYVKALNIKNGDKIKWILDTESESLILKILKKEE